MFNYFDDDNDLKNDEQNDEQNEEQKELENEEFFEEDKYENTDETQNELEEDEDQFEEQEDNFNDDIHDNPIEEDQVDRYYENMRQHQNTQNTNNNSYVSKKTVTLIVSLCLVLAIICGVCVGIMSASLRRQVLENTTTQAPAVETTSNEKTNNNESDKSSNPASTNTQTPTVQTQGELVQLKANDVGKTALSVKEVYRKVNASVVVIKATSTESTSGGSGVVVTKDGYIVTNYHVANPSNTKIEIGFSDGSVLEATYVLGDESSDIALLKVDKNDCAAAELVNSEQIEVGDVAIVIGNALGRGITLTAGYISALSRTITVDGNTMTLLQTDATINLGNSGGGLFNEYGQLVGIVNSKTGGSNVEGTGYAIPVNNVLKVIDDLQTNGYITGKARLGITMTVIGSSFSSYGYIQVKAITPGGSVESSGIKESDILYMIDGTTITSTTVLSETLAKYKVGDTVKVTVLRPTKDISEFKTQSWFLGTITYDYESYLNACEQIEFEVTFVEFNPNN